jgi:hypothetical protein
MEEIEFGRAVPGQAGGKRLGASGGQVSGPKKEEESPDPSPNLVLLYQFTSGTG